MQNWEYCLLVGNIETKIDNYLKEVLVMADGLSLSPDWCKKMKIEKALSETYFSFIMEAYIRVLKNSKMYGYEQK